MHLCAIIFPIKSGIIHIEKMKENIVITVIDRFDEAHDLEVPL